MSMIVRDADVDLDVLRARVSPDCASDALAYVEDAINALSGVEKYREEREGEHELLRALKLARNALADALDG